MKVVSVKENITVDVLLNHNNEYLRELIQSPKNIF